MKAVLNIELNSWYSPSLHALKDWSVKSDVTWFLRGETNEKKCQWKESWPSLFILDKRKWRTFHLKDKKYYVKMFLEVIITFLKWPQKSLCQTVMMETLPKLDYNLVHFARLQIVISNQLNCDYLYCVVPENIHTPPRERIENFLGVGGSQRSKNLSKCMKLLTGISSGLGGCKDKTLPLGRYGHG